MSRKYISIAYAVAIFCIVLIQEAQAARVKFILTDQILIDYIERFNADDNDLYSQLISNSNASNFLLENIPLFDCPDKVTSPFTVVTST